MPLTTTTVTATITATEAENATTHKAAKEAENTTTFKRSTTYISVSITKPSMAVEEPISVTDLSDSKSRLSRFISSI
ncbi:hypothetical protein Tco_0899110 [Tanacetum coccineum]